MRALVLCISFLAAGLSLSADTLHLKSGQTIHGRLMAGLLKGSSGIQFIGIDGRTRIYPYQEVDNLISARSRLRHNLRRLSGSWSLPVPSFSFE